MNTKLVTLEAIFALYVSLAALLISAAAMI